MTFNSGWSLQLTANPLIAFALAFVTYLVYQAYLHPLAHIPGPTSARFSGWWRNKHLARGTWHEDILELHRKYGRVVRIAPNEVAVVDATVVKQLYGHGTVALKTRWYSTFDPDVVQSLFSEREPKSHAHLRKRLAGAYSMTSVLKYESGIQASVDELFHKFNKYAGQEINLSDWTGAFAFDNTGRLGFGEPLRHIATETDVMDLRATILQGFQMQSTLGHFYIQLGSFFWGQMQIVRNAFTMSLLKVLKQKIPMQDFIDYGEVQISKRQAAVAQGEIDDKDMMNHFLAMKQPDGSPVTHPEIRIEALTLM